MQHTEAQSQQILPRSGRGGERFADTHTQVDDGASVVFPATGGLCSQSQTPQAPRRRPRVITAQDLDEALLQAIEGKITRKNAWVSKDASNLLDGITQTVESTLDSNSTVDEYTSFAKVATVVEGCSKVWTSRVDSTYQRSNQMVRRLLRNEDEGHGSDEENKEEGDGEGGAPSTSAAAERRRRAAQRKGQTVRTIAFDLSEINLDRKARLALVRTGVSAQFRAITEKFDQGNAQGLLVHNTPIGGAGNLILDVDYVREPDGDYTADCGRHSGQSDKVKREPDEGENINTTARGFADGGIEDGVDEGLGITLDLPPFTASHMQSNAEKSSLFVCGGGHLVGDGAGSAVSTNDRSGEGARVSSSSFSTDPNASGRPSLTVPSLLAVPHTVQGNPDVLPDDATRVATNEQDGNEEHDYQDGGWFDGMDGADADYGLHDGGESIDQDRYTADNDRGEESNPELSPERVALEARRLVSGVTDLNIMDNRLRNKQLALEVDDPSGWVPMAEPVSNPMFGARARKNSTIMMTLRKQHHFLGPSVAQSSISTQSLKRLKREAAVFDLPGELEAVSATASRRSAGTKEKSTKGDDCIHLPPVFALLEDSGVDNSALKQSTSEGKNMSALGKELLLGRDSSAIKPYLQTSVELTKAQEAGLLVRENPVPGVTVPSYLPYPITVPVFFQPFSTPLSQWNLLRKSATGSTIHHYNNTTSYGYADEDADGNGAGDMPAEFFHGGVDSDNDYGDVGTYDGFNDSTRDDTLDNPLKLAQAQIFASLDQADLIRSSTALTTLSGNSARPSSMNVSDVADIDPDTVVKVLHAPEAMLPTQVDVVLLRKIMWASLTGAAGCEVTGQQESQRVSRRKRGRVAGTEGPTQKEDNQGSDDGVKKVRFSEVVLQLLPQVSTVSATGALSPAFFFFSLLFLANEHGLLIESIPTLDDLVIHVPPQRGDASETMVNAD